MAVGAPRAPTATRVLCLALFLSALCASFVGRCFLSAFPPSLLWLVLPAVGFALELGCIKAMV